MLYLIGLGLNEKGTTLEGAEAVKNCDKVYLENYTVEFPYSLEDLERSLEVKITALEREDVESNKLIKEAKEKNITLLVYGCPLVATTHLSLIYDCLKKEVKYKVINSASIFDAVIESGLQLYKFGKVTSMPKWDEENNYKPDSFMEIVKDNQSVESHSLILCDIGLKFPEALEQLKKSSENHDFSWKERKIVVCKSLGTEKQKFYYGGVEKLLSLKPDKIKNPFCLIIPGRLHHIEEEILKNFEI